MARPAAKLTAADREVIRQHKAALLDLLCAARQPTAAPVHCDRADTASEDAAPPQASAALAIPPEPVPEPQPEPEPQAIPALALPLPLDLQMLFDAVLAAPRSPIENDLAYARLARVAVELSHLLDGFTPDAQRKALVMCSDTAQVAAGAIRGRNYLQAYELLATLPTRIRALRPQ